MTLGYAKRPAPTACIARIFPHRLDSLVEEMDGVAELEVSDVEVVEDAPELADVVDVGKRLKTVFVCARWSVVGAWIGSTVLTVMPEVPAVHKRRGAILLEAALKEVQHLRPPSGRSSFLLLLRLNTGQAGYLKSRWRGHFWCRLKYSYAGESLDIS